MSRYEKILDLIDQELKDIAEESGVEPGDIISKYLEGIQMDLDEVYNKKN